MDAILKIYSKNSSWADTLDHEIAGELVDYTLTRYASGMHDQFQARIADPTRYWMHEIQQDGYDDTNEVVQVWRLHSRDDSLIGSGIIDDVHKRGTDCILTGKGMSALLARPTVEDKEYTTQTGAHILADSTSGLIKAYLGTLYGTLDYTTHVTAPSNNITNRYNGRLLWDICREVGKNSYNTGRHNPWNTTLFETYDGSSYTMNVYFKERWQDAKSLTITPGMIRPRDVDLRESNFSQFTRIRVYGAWDKEDNTPEDKDKWTEDSSLPVGLWNSGAASSGTSEIGSYSVAAEYDVDLWGTLNLTSAAAYSDTSNHMESGVGYKPVWDGMDQYLHVFIRPNYSAVIRIGLEYTGAPDYKFKYITVMATGGVWNSFDFNIRNIIGGDWEKIRYVNIMFINPVSTNTMLIDGLYFYYKKRFSGSSEVAGLSYYREYPYYDDGLKTDADCGNMASYLLEAFRRHQFGGRLSLRGPDREFGLIPGDTVEVIFPDMDIDISSGQTPATLPVEKIEYKPNIQTLHMGKVMTLDEVVNESKMQMRRISNA